MKPAPTHLLTLTWDDGFAKSFAEIARIHEAFGLTASLNIIAQACVPGAYAPADEWHNAPTGGWDLWNELAARGHEINPHSWSHRNHARIPFAEAKDQIDRCLDAFREHLKGFTSERCVYGYPYNAGTAETDAYLLTRVRAVRGGGNGVNPMPTRDLRRITTTAFGPGNCEAHLDGCLATWLASSGGWLAYNTHGLGEEGWGPVTGDYLRRLYVRLLQLPHVAIVTPAAALAAAAQ